LDLKRFYHRFTGRAEPFARAVYEGKYRIMVESMTGELGVLAHRLSRLAERDRSSRDFTLESLRRALREAVADWPLYRTYVTAGGWTDADQRAVDDALARVRQRHPGMEPSVLEFLRRHFLPDAGAPDPTGALGFAMRFQQYTSPVQAKGVEDTAFYRYVPLLSVNEVGGGPHPFGRSVRELHDANARRRQRHPHGMLSTSTHDTKRGEDARQRINALSQFADEWRRKALEWSRLNAGNRGQVAGAHAPDRNEEYLLYQSLLGVWPADAPPDAAPEGILERLRTFALKALREEKSHTSWIHNDPVYEEAVRQFLELALTGPKARRFLASFTPFMRKAAFHGALTSLAQTAIKAASPGVPDLYQGAELWDLSLADPDNRRSVDFTRRAAFLAEMRPHLDPAAPMENREGFLESLFSNWPDGRVKMFVVAALLAARRRQPELFLHGDYRPLSLEGPDPDAFFAFARTAGTRRLLVVAPRRTADRAEEGPEGPSWRWDGHFPLLPDGWQDGPWRNALTGRASSGGPLILDEVAPGFPVAFLLDDPSS
jgi:(1->4)-alpha-D-glucan 1-alpha-D-glucosylmutase